MESKLLEGSQQSIRSNLLLEKNLDTDISVVGSDYVPLYSLFNPTEETVPIQHMYNGSAGHFLDFFNSFLKVRGSITKKNGNKLSSSDKVAYSTLSGHGMFAGMQVFLNDHLVSSSNSMYPYIAYFTRTFSTSLDQRNTVLACEFMHDSGTPDDFTAANPDWISRAKYTAESQKVEFCIRLVESIFVQQKYFPPNTTFKLSLRRNDPEHFLESPDTDFQYKFNIEESVYLLRRIIAHASILSQHQTMGGRRYYFPTKKYVVRSFNVVKGLLSFTSEPISNDVLPTLIIVGISTSKAINGVGNLSPYYFAHKNVSSMSAIVEDDASLYQQIKVNTTDDLHMVAYKQLMDTVQIPGMQVHLTYAQFTKGSFFFAFQYSGNNGTNSFSPRRTGSVKLDMSFSAETSDVLRVVTYSVYQSLITLDSSGVSVHV